MGGAARLRLCLPLYFGYRPAIRGLKGYWEAADRVGRDRNPFRAGYLQLVAISDTDAQAEADYADAAAYFYHRCLHVPDYFFAAPGYVTPESKQAAQTPFSTDSLQSLRWKDMVDEGYIIAGSPATVRERLREIVRELNVGHLIVLCQFGNLSRETTLRNTDLYAREVMPHLKDLWSEWTDRWSPQPLARPPRALGAAPLPAVAEV
ncbi:MAG: LLM class flavin-dependent oxidoreductase [Deltaproteobacteria bacterium]|nr:LLM class flavin-dependent oxidoreductase [Deltaproteobacteria bacterium]